MRLIIDTRNGLSGDIASAGLMGLGVNPGRMLSAMTFAAELVGPVKILPVLTEEFSAFEIEHKGNLEPLPEQRAVDMLDDILHSIDIGRKYQEIGSNILAALCEAERYVHTHDPRLQHMLTHAHHHPHHPDFGASRQQALLHETQDILLDIAGFIVGLQELEVEYVHYLGHVNVGNGKITFSHGTFDIPAPATRYILENHGFTWMRSDQYDMEMTTPTGASILAGVGALHLTSLDSLDIKDTALAHGTRRDLPPITFHLAEEP